MSLQLNLAELITAIGGEIKALRQNQGSLAALSTAEKASLVGAINELQGEIDSIATTLNSVSGVTLGKASAIARGLPLP